MHRLCRRHSLPQSKREITLFERMSEEPLPLELEAGNVMELVALSESHFKWPGQKEANLCKLQGPCSVSS